MTDIHNVQILKLKFTGPYAKDAKDQFEVWLIDCGGAQMFGQMIDDSDECDFMACDTYDDNLKEWVIATYEKEEQDESELNKAEKDADDVLKKYK